MRLPWLQVEQDGIAQCKRLARLLGVPDAQGIGIGVLVWQYALEIAPEGDFRGFVPDPGILAAEVGWSEEDTPRLVTQLQRVGIVGTVPSLRVRGLDRYIRAWEKNSGKKAIHRESGVTVPEPGTNPAPVAPEPARQTQTHIFSLPSEGSSTPAPPAKPRKRPDVSDADPRHQPLIDGLCRVFAEVRGAKLPFGGREAVGVKALLLTGTDPAVILEAWRRALTHRGFPTVSTPGELHQHLAHFVGAAPPARAGDARAPAPVPDWSNAASGEIPA